MNHKINIKFKILYILGIIFVVAGHTGYNGFNFNGLFQYDSFHMGLFVFASGYFFHFIEDVKYIIDRLIRKTKKLLGKYYIYNLLYFLIAVAITLCMKKDIFGGLSELLSIKRFFCEPIIIGNQYIYNVAAWFVITLYFVQIVYLLLFWIIRLCLRKWQDKIAELASIIATVMGILGVLLSQSDIQFGLKLCLTRILVLLVPYSIGVLYNKYESIINKCPSLILLFGCIVGQLVLMLIEGAKSNTSIIYSGNYPFNPIVTYLYMLFGIMFWLQISKGISCVIERFGMPWLFEYIGNHTFEIMVNHCICLKVVVGMSHLLLRYVLNVVHDFDYSKFWSSAWYFPDFGYSVIFRNIYVIFGVLLPIFLSVLFDKFVGSVEICKYNLRGIINKDR